MLPVFRDDRVAVHARLADLQEENEALRAELAGTPRARTRARRRTRLGVALGALGALVIASVVIGYAVHLRVRAARATQLATSHASLAAPDMVWTWEEEKTGTTERLRAVTATSEGIFAVGDHGTILFRDPSGTWSQQSSGGEGSSFYAVGGDPIFAVGEHGAVVWFDATTRAWVREESGTSEDLYGVDSYYAQTYAVGAHGTILARDRNGGGWTSVPSGTTRDLHAVLMTRAPWRPATSIHAVGDDGTILVSTPPRSYYGGTFAIWTPQVTPSHAPLRSIIIEGPSRVYVGGDGTLLTTATTAPVPWTEERNATDIAALVRRSDGSALAVSRNGVPIDHGATWHLAESHGPGTFVARGAAAAIRSGSTDDIVVVGDNGRAIRWSVRPQA